MFRFLKNVFTSRSLSQKARKPRCRKASLGVEVLERRELLATASLSSGVIQIVGTNAPDNVKVAINDNGTSTVFDDKVVVTMKTAWAPKARPKTQSFDLWKLTPTTPDSPPLYAMNVLAVHFYGDGCNDRFENLTSISCYAEGGLGKDLLIGGSGEGNDTMYGGQGNDQLWDMQVDGEFIQEGGKDRLYGGEGDDRLAGGSDRDRLYGGSGKDTLDGGLGDDYLNGGNFSWGGPGNDGIADDLYGREGKDTFVAELYLTALGKKNRDHPKDLGFGGTADVVK